MHGSLTKSRELMAEKMDRLRSKMPDFYEVSFPTISAADSNAAIIHYVAKNGSSALVKDSSMYLLDSGGFYLCHAPSS